MKVRNKKQVHQTTAQTVLKGCIAGVLTLTLGACLISYMIYQGTIDEMMLQMMCKPVLFLGAFIASFLSIAKVNTNYMLPLVSTGVILYLILIGVNILIFDGEFSGIGGSTIAFALGVCLAVCVKIVRWKAGSKGRMKYRFR